MTHLLVTNDFPPKLGGIQSYLFELWRRLPPDDFAVLTARGPKRALTGLFDEGEPYRIVRTNRPVLLPTPSLAWQIRVLATEIGADLVLIDPALPLGLIGVSLGVPYGLVLHGAEVAVPGRLPVGRALLSRVLRGASLVVAAGHYPEQEARRAARGRLPHVVVVPPTVDTARFRPLAEEERRAARAGFGLPAGGRLVVSVSRLVPRKGMDVLIEASAKISRERPDLTVAIGGTGRDRGRLEEIAARTGAPVRLLGRIDDEDLPGLVGCADVFAMLCRDRWGGLEQEGFGIVFLEAAAAGVPQVAGRSGGADEAVRDGVTGVVVDRPRDTDAVATALADLLDDEERRGKMGIAARERVVAELEPEALTTSLREAIADATGRTGRRPGPR